MSNPTIITPPSEYLTAPDSRHACVLHARPYGACQSPSRVPTPDQHGTAPERRAHFAKTTQGAPHGHTRAWRRVQRRRFTPVRLRVACACAMHQRQRLLPALSPRAAGGWEWGGARVTYHCCSSRVRESIELPDSPSTVTSTFFSHGTHFANSRCQLYLRRHAVWYPT